MMTVELNIDEFISEIDAAQRDLTEDLHQAGVKAAEDGVLAAKQEHPYTDRTGDLTGEARAEEDHAKGGGIMTWPVEYATFVDGRGYDAGNKPSGKFKYTPRAVRSASFSLESKAQEAIDKFVARLER